MYEEVKFKAKEPRLYECECGISVKTACEEYRCPVCGHLICGQELRSSKQNNQRNF